MTPSFHPSICKLELSFIEMKKAIQQKVWGVGRVVNFEIWVVFTILFIKGSCGIGR